MKKAVVLVSGGIDSTVCLALAKREGYKIFALSFNYNQRHKIELEKICLTVKKYNIGEHKIINLDLSFLQRSGLINKQINLNQNLSEEIPITYVPARNTIFLSYALSYAESIDASAIFIGIHKEDSDYPDCTENFRQSFEKLANIGTSYFQREKKIQIFAPLIHLTKSQIIKKAVQLKVDFTNTISCYDPSIEGLSCGVCLSCKIRLKAFKDNNISDPVKYK